MKILLAGLVFLLIFGIIGAIMGAFRILVSVLLLSICICTATVLSPKVSGFLGLENKITQNVREIMEKQLGDKIETMESDEQEDLLEKLHLPASWQKEIERCNNNDWLIEHNVNSFKDLVVDKVSRNIAVNASFVIVAILLFVVLRIFLKVVHLMDLILKLPILKGANKFVGFWMGILLGVVFLNIILAGLPLLQQYDWGQRVVNALNSNFLSGFIYRHNLLVWFLSRL